MLTFWIFSLNSASALFYVADHFTTVACSLTSGLWHRFLKAVILLPFFRNRPQCIILIMLIDILVSKHKRIILMYVMRFFILEVEALWIKICLYSNPVYFFAFNHYVMIGSLLCQMPTSWTLTVLSLRWDQAAQVHYNQDYIKYDYAEVGGLLALRFQRPAGIYGSLQRGVSIRQTSGIFL